MLVMLYCFQSYWFAVPSSSWSCINKDIKSHNEGFFTLTEHRFKFFFFAPLFSFSLSFLTLLRFFLCFFQSCLFLNLLTLSNRDYCFLQFFLCRIRLG